MSTSMMRNALLLTWACALAMLPLLGNAQEETYVATTDDGPRIYRVIVPVEDLEKAATFYAELLGLPGQRISGGRHYIDCGGVILALYQPAGDGDEQPARPLPDHLYLAVKDIEAYHARARELGVLSEEVGDGDLPMGEIRVRPWRERSFYARDLYGTPLCFVDDETLFTGF